MDTSLSPLARDNPSRGPGSGSYSLLPDGRRDTGKLFSGKVLPEYAHRYLGEFQYRFNRRFDLSTLLPRMLVAAVNTVKRPERWLRLAEDPC